MTVPTAHPLLYEINTRVWLRELSRGRGRTLTLAGVPAEVFAAWREAGFTHIWLMGAWTSGPQAARVALESEPLRQEFDRIQSDWATGDVAASPYAIAEYAVSPALGGAEELALFRARLHEHGLRLLLDFVPNHLGLDHPWAVRRPERFVQAPGPAKGFWPVPTPGGPCWLAHGKDPHFAPWSDTLQLDYRREETRQAMIDLLLGVAQHCDGVRCDMAMLLLNEVFARTWVHTPAPEPAPATEFWQTAIGRVKAGQPDFLFLAEVYWDLEARLRELGFDYTYDKTLYDRLMQRDAAGVLAHVRGLARCGDGSGLTRAAHFLENHDEPRVAARLSFPEHRAALWTVLSLPGMRFLHEGQLEGARTRLPVQFLGRPPERDAALTEMYREALQVLRLTVVGQGSFHLPEIEGTDEVLAIHWGGGSPDAGSTLVVVNLSGSPRSCRFHPVLPGAGRAAAFTPLPGNPGAAPISGDMVHLVLAPHEVRVWNGSPV